MRTHAEPLLPPEVAATQVGGTLRLMASHRCHCHAHALLREVARAACPRQRSILCPHVSLTLSEDQHELLMRILDALTASAASPGNSTLAGPVAPQPERPSALLRTRKRSCLTVGHSVLLIPFMPDACLWNLLHASA